MQYKFLIMYKVFLITLVFIIFTASIFWQKETINYYEVLTTSNNNKFERIEHSIVDPHEENLNLSSTSFEVSSNLFNLKNIVIDKKYLTELHINSFSTDNTILDTTLNLFIRNDLLEVYSFDMDNNGKEDVLISYYYAGSSGRTSQIKNYLLLLNTDTTYKILSFNSFKGNLDNFIDVNSDGILDFVFFDFVKCHLPEYLETEFLIRNVFTIKYNNWENITDIIQERPFVIEFNLVNDTMARKTIRYPDCIKQRLLFEKPNVF